VTSETLISFLQTQRWFGGKARPVADVRILDEGPLVDGRAWLAIVETRFRDGGAERYFVPLAETRDAAILVDAVADDEACRTLVDVLESGAAIHLARGRLRASVGTSLPAGLPKAATLPVRRAAADQSNTSVLFGDELIMKVFRRVERGINPEVEISRFLTARGFTRVPALVADAEYESDAPAADGTGGSSSVLMLQQFVPNHGTAWQAMLADGSDASLALADILGRRTGELHEALASDTIDPAFAPERLSSDDLDAVAVGMRTFGARQLDLLRRATVADATRAVAHRVLERQDALLGRFDRMRRVAQPGSRIRCHGDYHLGQTLVTDGDVCILDFEGEPARSLAERRAKSSPLRDVAGMLRSFSYAAEASGRGETWEQAVGAAFLSGYRAATAHADFLPETAESFAVMLDAFVLDKTLYELGYELNNRPDWVHLPLTALARVRTPV